MKRIVVKLCVLAGLCGCTQFDDASPTERTSFMYFYGGAVSYEGKVAEITEDGGVIIGANIPGENGNYSSLIIKTDARGVKIWETPLEGTRISAIKPYNGGYLVVGDSIKINENPPELSEGENTKARLIEMDASGNITRQIVQGETLVISSTPLITRQVDYHASAVTFAPSGDVFLLGSRKVPGENERSFLAAIDPGNFQFKWTQQYGLFDRDYLNCNSLFLTTSNNLIWASRTFRSVQNVSDQYVSISYVEPNATFANNSLYGENFSDFNHIVEDIQPSVGGYLVTGTYANQSGREGNIYFLKVHPNGNVIEGSARYFDAQTLQLSGPEAGSNTEDTGNAVTAVGGGYVIAGSVESTVDVGNGGRDIILIKVDIQGNYLWSRILGGAGDQFASSIRRTESGGLLICGTNSTNGLSTVMIIKTNADGIIEE